MLGAQKSCSKHEIQQFDWLIFWVWVQKSCSKVLCSYNLLDNGLCVQARPSLCSLLKKYLFITHFTRLLAALWTGCCLFDIFHLSILNFIKIKRIGYMYETTDLYINKELWYSCCWDIYFQKTKKRRMYISMVMCKHTLGCIYIKQQVL